MKFQAWNTPALDKEENSTVIETTSETTTIVEKPDESEASREDEKEILNSPLLSIKNWEALAKHYTLKLMESQNDKHIEDIEERLDNEDNDSLEDVTNWAVRQKQSMINK